MNGGSAGQRVLVTAAASRLGGLVVAVLERDPAVEAIIAVDGDSPAAPFARAEFVRLRDDYAQLGRVTAGAGVDVVVDVRPIAALAPPDHRAVVALAAGNDRVFGVCRERTGGIRRLVLLSSAHRYGWSGSLPRFVGEDTLPAAGTDDSPLRRALSAVETGAEAVARERDDLTLTVLRIADAVGPAGAGLLQALDVLPLLPTVLGIDPPLQVVHEEDLARATAHAVAARLGGTYVVAADGTLALSEALQAIGANHAPLLPPWGLGLLSRLLARGGLSFAEDVAGSLRHGRGFDNRRLKATGFAYTSTTREALATVVHGRRHRLALGAGVMPAEQAYDSDVEAFLRYSPSARHVAAPEAQQPVHGVAALDAEALLALLPSLDPTALHALRAHEQAGPHRERLLAEIDLLLAGR